MEKKTILEKVKKFLVELTGIETALEDQMLVDGVTTIQANKFEAGEQVFIVTTDMETVPLPIGEYELKDGKILVVVEDGIISEIKDAPATEENPKEAVSEVPVEAEKAPEQMTAKKIVRTSTEEQHFSKIEELEKEIVELKSKVVELETVEPKPIKHNPENAKPVERFGKSVRTAESNILSKVYN